MHNDLSIWNPIVQIDEGYLTEPVSIEYPTENSLTAFLNYYPPKNKDFKLPAGEKPPLLVKIHGGPTSQASTAFSPVYQYWTSRGQVQQAHQCALSANTLQSPGA